MSTAPRAVSNEAVQNRLLRLADSRPEVTAAKNLAKRGQCREALTLLVSIGLAEQHELAGYDKWEAQEWQRLYNDNPTAYNRQRLKAALARLEQEGVQPSTRPVERKRERDQRSGFVLARDAQVLAELTRLYAIDSITGSIIELATGQLVETKFISVLGRRLALKSVIKKMTPRKIPMRGIARVTPPSAIKRRLDRLRADSQVIIDAKHAFKQGEHRRALELLVLAGEAEAGHLDSYDRWLAEQPASAQSSTSMEAFV